MTLLYRIALLGLLTSLMTACETLYLDQPVQPAPVQVYVPVSPQPQPVPPAAYPSQPQPASVPAQQMPPLPQSAPSRAVAPPPPRAPAAVMPEGDSPHGNVIPVRAPGSVSDLPDPS